MLVYIVIVGCQLCLLTLAISLLQEKHTSQQKDQQQPHTGIIYVDTIQKCDMMAEYMTTQLGLSVCPTTAACLLTKKAAAEHH